MTLSAPLAAMRRALWALLFAGALLARLASPSGWMPEASATGAHLVPCDGMAPAMPRAMAGMAHHGHDGKTSAADHPCAFAGVGLALAEPLPPPPLPAPSPARVVPSFLHSAVTIGRGLAAPPPPATGPPLLA